MKKISFTSEIVEATEKVRNTAVDLAPVYPSPKVTSRAAQGLTKIDKRHIGGLLRSSISSKVFSKGKDNVFGYVFTPVEYAIYQEFGTSKQPGTPFLRPALNINRAGIQQSMKKYLRDKLKEAVR